MIVIGCASGSSGDRGIGCSNWRLALPVFVLLDFTCDDPSRRCAMLDAPRAQLESSCAVICVLGFIILAKPYPSKADPRELFHTEGSVRRTVQVKK